ncbi:2-C-methyl-D-erythritol 4-phosphate cytidylyltransferase [Bacillus thuringiensis serovar navarrensis]|uniref:2-C-methyl-D-erythritol 4-phosphate cytidylyltransferase n=1 Tax=Bacillus thuringiensis serovar navarrensis TaxID=339658 RepID=A0A243A861_BACTU|nr:2-C-methyl-D-erythritol 4-phosphate cytidylyltransferase [Bacillus thuringiensis serovar navarrensis]
MLTRSPPYTGVFTHHFTCVYCISKILSYKKFSFIIPKSKMFIKNKQIKKSSDVPLLF